MHGFLTCECPFNCSCSFYAIWYTQRSTMQTYSKQKQRKLYCTSSDCTQQCTIRSGNLNINSIRNTFDTVRHMEKYMDILAQCETKLDVSFPIVQFNVPGYNCIRRDRSNNGGGLTYYIRSDIPPRRRDDLEHAIDSHLGFKIIIMEITVNHIEKWLYALGYKPAEIKNSVFDNVFQLLCDVMMNESSNIVLLGDCNCNLLKENSLAHICDTYLRNLVTSATCFKGIKGTLVDVCFVSKPLRFKSALSLDCWLSDFITSST